MADEITAELYSSWKRHPVTDALFSWMVQEIEDSKEAWLNGNFTHEGNSDATFLIQARQQERARIYRELISQTAEEFLQALGSE